MDGATFYEVLGLARSAPDAVIRSAYKALVLIHHPDKTIELSVQDREAHTAKFHQIQEAYDILGTADKKSGYDALLYDRNEDTYVHRGSTYNRSKYTASTKNPKAATRKAPGVPITTQEQKRNVNASIDHELAGLDARRIAREAEDALLDLAVLAHKLETWVDMTKTYANDPTLHAYCVAQVQMYQNKVELKAQADAACEESHQAGYASQVPVSEAHRQAQEQEKARKEALKQARLAAKQAAAQEVNQPKHDKQNATAAACRTVRQAREQEKARKEVLKQARFAAKKAAVQEVNQPKHDKQNATAAAYKSVRLAREEDKARKEALKQARLDATKAAAQQVKQATQDKVEAIAAAEAARVAKTRAKVAPVSSPSARGSSTVTEKTDKISKTRTKKPCQVCGAEHASVLEFKKCAAARLRKQSERGEAMSSDMDTSGSFVMV